MEGPEAVAPEARHWLKLSAPLEFHPPRTATSEPDVGTPCLELGVPGNYTWGRQPLQGLDRCIWGCEDDLTHFGPLIAKAVRVPSILYLYSLPGSYWPALL